jgi:hypothetical protein
MKIERVCIECGKTFFAFLCQIKRGHGNFCSKSCATRYRNKVDNPAKKSSS